MKNFKILIILFLSLTVFGKGPSLTTAESLATAKLRESFKLPNGPATNMSSFYIKGTGAFFILNCELSFNSSMQTPFGPTKSKKRNSIDKEEIYQIMKETLVEIEKYIEIGKQEKIFLIVVDAKVFKNPFEKSSQKKIYKISMEKGNKELNKIEIN